MHFAGLAYQSFMTCGYAPGLGPESHANRKSEEEGGDDYRRDDNTERDTHGGINRVEQH